MDNIKKFDDSILSDAEFQKISLSDLKPDDFLRSLYDDANPIALLRSNSKSNLNPDYLFNTSALISPLIVYSYRGHYRYLIGHFTMMSIRHAVTVKSPDQPPLLPAFVLKKKPTEEIRLALLQFELTQHMLERGFVSDTKNLMAILNQWFQKDVGKKSIFQSKQWQSIYPDITSVDAFAKYLSVGKSELK